MANALIITDIVNFKGISVTQLEKGLGMSNGALRKAISRESQLKNETINNLIQIFPDLNEDALRKDEGDLFDYFNPAEPQLDALESTLTIPGLGPKRYRRQDHPRAKTIFFKNLEYLTRKAGVSVPDLLDGTQITWRQFKQFGEGVNPDYQTLSVFSKYFDVPVTDLAESLIENMSGRAQSFLNASTNNLEVIKVEDATEFRHLGEDRYIVITPLIPDYAYESYRTGWEDVEYVDEIPKHAIVVDQLQFGVYRSFRVIGDGMDNGMKSSISNGDIVTGRRIERKLWKDKLNIHSFNNFIIHTNDQIFINNITAHDSKIGTIICQSLNPDKNNYPDKEISLDDVVEIYNIVSRTPGK